MTQMICMCPLLASLCSFANRILWILEQRRIFFSACLCLIATNTCFRHTLVTLAVVQKQQWRSRSSPQSLSSFVLVSVGIYNCRDPPCDVFVQSSMVLVGNLLVLKNRMTQIYILYTTYMNIQSNTFASLEWMCKLTYLNTTRSQQQIYTQNEYEVDVIKFHTNHFLRRLCAFFHSLFIFCVNDAHIHTKEKKRS